MYKLILDCPSRYEATTWKRIIIIFVYNFSSTWGYLQSPEELQGTKLSPLDCLRRCKAYATKQLRKQPLYLKSNYACYIAFGKCREHALVNILYVLLGNVSQFDLTATVVLPLPGRSGIPGQLLKQSSDPD